MNKTIHEHTQSSSEESSSSAEARATRLRRLRNLANLSRKEMCERSGIKPDTLIGWEVARHGGLTENGAKKIISCVATEGVQCTLDWLLFETGSGPFVLPTIEHKAQSQKQDSSTVNNEEKFIIDELILFKSQYLDAVHCVIQDEAMAPQYSIGDYVAGVKRHKTQISQLIGYDCIIELADGSLLVRSLHEGSNKNHYTLLSNNTKNTAASTILHNVEVISAAPIIWIRKKNP